MKMWRKRDFNGPALRTPETSVGDASKDPASAYSAAAESFFLGGSNVMCQGFVISGRGTFTPRLHLRRLVLLPTELILMTPDMSKQLKVWPLQNVLDVQWHHRMRFRILIKRQKQPGKIKKLRRKKQPASEADFLNENTKPKKVVIETYHPNATARWVNYIKKACGVAYDKVILGEVDVTWVKKMKKKKRQSSTSSQNEKGKEKVTGDQEMKPKTMKTKQKHTSTSKPLKGDQPSHTIPTRNRVMPLKEDFASSPSQYRHTLIVTRPPRENPAIPFLPDDFAIRSARRLSLPSSEQEMLQASNQFPAPMLASLGMPLSYPDLFMSQAMSSQAYPMSYNPFQLPSGIYEPSLNQGHSMPEMSQYMPAPRQDPSHIFSPRPQSPMESMTLPVLSYSASEAPCHVEAKQDQPTLASPVFIPPFPVPV